MLKVTKIISNKARNALTRVLAYAETTRNCPKEITKDIETVREWLPKLPG